MTFNPIYLGEAYFGHAGTRPKKTRIAITIISKTEYVPKFVLYG